MAEEEVNYASVVFKANKSPTAEGEKNILKNNIHCWFHCTGIFLLKYSLNVSTGQDPSKFTAFVSLVSSHYLPLIREGGGEVTALL